MDKTEIEAKLDELRREKDSVEGALSETSQQKDKLGELIQLTIIVRLKFK